MGYNFTVSWLAGKHNLIADALSRYPLLNEDPEINEDKEILIPCFTSVQFLTQINPNIEINLQELVANASNDYKQLLHSIRNSHTSPNNPASKQYKKEFEHLSICNKIPDLILYKGNRILIPQNYIRKILNWLHFGHNGKDKTISLAKQLYYWQTMNNDIDQMIKKCPSCQELRPSLQKLPMLQEQTFKESRPMESVSTDLFLHAGKDYLVLVDRYSDYIFCSDALSKTNTSTILNVLIKWFQLFGYPSVIRSDGGPQFRSEFDNFCASKNITHELTSPYNPQSNGLAENAVKQAKHLLIKSLENKENFQEALSFYRNVPNASGYSPAELLFGRRQKLPIPTLSEHHDPINMKVAIANRDLLRERAKNNYNKHARSQTPLSIGDKVLIQDTDTHRWCYSGYIRSVRPDNISFEIELPTGQVIIRGRRFLKPHPVPDISDTPSSSAPSTPSSPAPPSPPPAPSAPSASRPRRNRRRPARYQQ